jgi:hypothetical protein
MHYIYTHIYIYYKVRDMAAMAHKCEMRVVVFICRSCAHSSLLTPTAFSAGYSIYMCVLCTVCIVCMRERVIVIHTHSWTHLA